MLGMGNLADVARLGAQRDDRPRLVVELIAERMIGRMGTRQRLARDLANQILLRLQGLHVAAAGPQPLGPVAQQLDHVVDDLATHCRNLFPVR